MIILTADERPYKVGNFIESSGIKYPPTAPKTTYIIHDYKITVKEIQEWIPIVNYRMVFVIKKLPRNVKKIEDEIIIDKSLNQSKDNYKRGIDALFRWNDRERARKLFTGTPIPLAMAFLKANHDDIEIYRKLSQVIYQLPDSYAEAIMLYGLTPNMNRVNYPKKSKKDNDTPPLGFRESDIYWRDIVKISPKVRNEIRVKETTLPKGVKKTKESILEWL